MYTPVKKKQKIIDDDMDWTRGGVVKLKGEVYCLVLLHMFTIADFSLKLTPLKDIPKRITISRPRHSRISSNKNTVIVDDLICK